jgi:hypothetical protein
MGDDFRGFPDKHHIFNAVKFISSKTEDKEKKFDVFDSILPFNSYNGNGFPNVSNLPEFMTNKTINSVCSPLDFSPEDFLYLPQSNVYITKSIILKGLSWNDAFHQAENLGLHMANLEIFIELHHNIAIRNTKIKNGNGEFIEKPPLEKIFSNSRNNFNIWLDACFKRTDNTITIFTDHKIQGDKIIPSREYQRKFDLSGSNIKIKDGKIKKEDADIYPKMCRFWSKLPPYSGAFIYQMMQSYEDYGKRLSLFVKPGSVSKKRGILAYVDKKDFEDLFSKKPVKKTIPKSKYSLHPMLEELCTFEINEQAEQNLVWSFGNHHTQGEYFCNALSKSSCYNLFPQKHLVRGVNCLALYNEQRLGSYQKINALLSFPDSKRYAVTYIGQGENIDMTTISLIFSQKNPIEKKAVDLTEHVGAFHVHISEFRKGEKTNDLIISNPGGKK